MRHLKFFVALSSLLLLGSCSNSSSKSSAKNDSMKNQASSSEEHSDFQWQTEQFADLRILRYRVPGWDKLPLQQKKLAYYLTQAGLEGRDIFWDQLYRHNLEIRRALEKVMRNYQPGEEEPQWEDFKVYLKRLWFSNGIHHHYSHAKIKPEFDRAYLEKLLQATEASLSEEALAVIFNDQDAKGVSKDPDKDLVQASAVNFYGPEVTQAEVEEYYGKMMNPDDSQPISYGLNSSLHREDGEIVERKWKVGGQYGAAIEKIISWLEKAREVADNEQQARALGLLIEYYKTGDLQTWDEYNIAWVQDTASDVDYINSFIEVYHDPLGYKGTYETVVQIKDLDASEKMAVISDNIEYFEQNSPIADAHKKEDVRGVSYRMINVVGEAGATTPATPIGVNLPNADWIRAQHGSKSISLANIESAYEEAQSGGFLEEFTFTTEELERARNYGGASSKMHTALHEVVGHASGKLEPGVGTPKQTLKNYASTLEEARADLVALYYIPDTLLQNLDLVPDPEMAKAEYDSYIRNGLMLQLRRLEPGEEIEEDHMRNRQLVAAWAYEMGREDNVIERKKLKGKTYFVINDYEALRAIFGKQLKEIQRIKSQGDYQAGRKLVEQYGVQVDQDIHREVLERTEKLNIAPYSGFIQPRLEAVEQDGEITDVKISYPKDFSQQMLHYSEKYSNL